MVDAVNPTNCVLLGLGYWLKYHVAAGEDTSCNYFFDIEELKDAKAINYWARVLMNKIINVESLDEVM